MIEALQPILYSYDPEQEGVWVDATPFRAHLMHLLATGLTEPVIARLAGVSVRSVDHLAHGRRGRPVRRICGDTGRRLLRITTVEARAIRFRPVPVRPSRYRLRAMVAAGWTGPPARGRHRGEHQGRGAGPRSADGHLPPAGGAQDRGGVRAVGDRAGARRRLRRRGVSRWVRGGSGWAR